MAVPDETLVHALRSACADPRRAAAPALRDDARSLSYAEVHAAAGRLAGQLRAAGVREGERVALSMQRSADLALALLGTLAAGACPCPMEPGLGAEEAARRHRLARIDWTLHDAAHADDADLQHVPGEHRLAYEALPAADAFWAEHLPPEAHGLLLFTSGSSGAPKGVLQNHRGMLCNARGVIERTGLVASDRLLHVMPLYHTNGVNNQLIAPLLAGASVMLAGRFKAEDMPALMARHRPTLVTGVPTMFSRMLAHEFAPRALADLRMLRCGSAPITEELHRRIEAKFGLALVLSYGLSEATCTSVMNPPTQRRIGSVGRPLAGQQVFLQDGEICISGPALMSGYLEDGSEGRPRPMGEVLHTGDLGRMDEDGYLYITGRIKEVIIRGGEKLAPSLIEEALAGVPGVLACCVVGRPDADLGEVPVAFVVRHPSPAGAALDAAHLSDALKKKLARIYLPAEYRFLESLPENAVGKVDRKRLKAVLAG